MRGGLGPSRGRGSSLRALETKISSCRQICQGHGGAPVKAVTAVEEGVIEEIASERRWMRGSGPVPVKEPKEPMC